MGLLKGSTKDEIEDMIEEEYVSTYLIDTAVWPAVQAINFRYVPARFQAIYVNVISLGWAGFLSIVTNPVAAHNHVPDIPQRLQQRSENVTKPARY